MRLYKFHALTEAELINFLEIHAPDLSREEIKNIAHLAFGKPGKAFQFAHDPKLFNAFQALDNELGELMKKNNLADAFYFIGDYLKSETSPYDFLDVLLARFRQQMHDKIRSDGAASAQPLLQRIQKTFQAYALFERNVNHRLLFENLMLSS